MPYMDPFGLETIKFSFHVNLWGCFINDSTVQKKGLSCRDEAILLSHRKVPQAP